MSAVRSTGGADESGCGGFEERRTTVVPTRRFVSEDREPVSCLDYRLRDAQSRRVRSRSSPVPRHFEEMERERGGWSSVKPEERVDRERGGDGERERERGYAGGTQRTRSSSCRPARYGYDSAAASAGGASAFSR